MKDRSHHTKKAVACDRYSDIAGYQTGCQWKTRDDEGCLAPIGSIGSGQPASTPRESA
ncbi:hypothetical protein B0H10DRAFT_2103706, partial [Mycena sp. CBHHK59/15]